MSTKKWKKNEILEMLKTNDIAVVRGLVRIYERQTEDEKRVFHTKHDNKKGFNGADAPFLSKLAGFYIKNGYLTEKQIVIARKRMLKYAGQLAIVANELSKK